MEYREPDMGVYLRKVMYDRRLTVVWLSEQIGLRPRQTRHLLTMCDIKPSGLRRISKALGEDLYIQYLSEETKAVIVRGLACEEPKSPGSVV